MTCCCQPCSLLSVGLLPLGCSRRDADLSSAWRGLFRLLLGTYAKESPAGRRHARRAGRRWDHRQWPDHRITVLSHRRYPECLLPYAPKETLLEPRDPPGLCTSCVLKGYLRWRGHRGQSRPAGCWSSGMSPVIVSTSSGVSRISVVARFSLR